MSDNKSRSCKFRSTSDKSRSHELHITSDKSHSHELRITSGKLRGRKITTPGGATHPMGERERLALFNSLGDRVRDSRVLDLFAGSGALGFEALSRGSGSVVFVEKNQAAACNILDNMRSLKVESCATVIQADAFGVLRASELYHSIFDIIFCDPPYDQFDVDFNNDPPAVFEDISEHLSKKGVFVLSHPFDFSPELPGLHLVSAKKYARAHLSLYEKLP